jgi:hypothetical protein
LDHIIVRVHDVAAAVDAVRVIDVLAGRRDIPPDEVLSDSLRHEPPAAPRVSMNSTDARDAFERRWVTRYPVIVTLWRMVSRAGRPRVGTLRIASAWSTMAGNLIMVRV